MTPAFRSCAATLLLAAVLAGALAHERRSAAQTGSAADLVAIDAVVDGNTATSLGPIDGCVAAQPGVRVPIDLVVDRVPDDRPLIGFQITITYDPQVVQIAAFDHEYLLAAEGVYEPIEGLSDPVPDTDGRFGMAVADLSLEPNGVNAETGPGVLARVFVETRSPGLAFIGFPGLNEDGYPALIDDQNTQIPVNRVLGAYVSVGGDCGGAPAPQPTQLPPLEEVIATPQPTQAQQTPGTGTQTTPGTGAGTPTRGAAGEVTQSPQRSPGSPTRASPGAAPNGNGDGGVGTLETVLIGLLVLGGAGAVGAGGWLLVRRRTEAP